MVFHKHKTHEEADLQLTLQCNTAGFYLLGGRGKLPSNVSAPPPSKKSFREKNLQLFQIKIFFDDDFKESVKITNVQKCNFSQS